MATRLTTGRNRRRPQTFTEKFWEDKNGKVTIWQSPNRYLLIWLISTVFSWFMPFGNFERLVSLVSLVAIVMWAALEVWSGVNYFRRMLGALVLLTLIMTHFL